MGRKVALVLSSGGARGVAHIGVIEGLLENGFEISSIAGSSMGAVIGAVYAAGKLDVFREWITNLDRLDVIRLMDFTFSAQGFVRGERVFNEMSRFMGEMNIEELPIPFVAVATNVTEGREVVFRSGNLYEALRASAAIPSVMTPVMKDGHQLVDGGVLNPIPIQHVHREEGDILVVSDVNADIPIPAEMRKEPAVSQRWASVIERWNLFSDRQQKDKGLSYFELITRSVDLMQDRISDFIIQDMKPDLVVKTSRYTCSTFEFYKAEALINCGKSKLNLLLKDAYQ